MTTEVTTETTETANSETTSTDQTTASSASDTSTTTPADDKVDLSQKDDTSSTETNTDDTTDKGELFGAPEEGVDYEIAGLPEGMTIDSELLAEATPLFRELGLSNEGASRLAQTYAKGIEKAVTGAGAQLETQIAAQRSTWETSARAQISGKDAEGKPVEAYKNAAGEDLKFDTTEVKGVQRVAARALDRLAPEGFREWLDETGLGLHPMMIAFAYQAGQHLGEDRNFEGGSPPAKEPTREEKYYGKTN